MYKRTFVLIQLMLNMITLACDLQHYYATEIKAFNVLSLLVLTVSV